MSCAPCQPLSAAPNCLPLNFCPPEDFGNQFPTLVGPQGPPGGPGTFVPNYAFLRLLDATVFTAGYIAYVAGASTINDGGSGMFEYLPSSTDADNGGTIIRPANGIGRWFRIFTGPMSVKWFGAKGDGATNDQAALAAMATYAASIATSSVRPIIYFPVSSGAYVLTSGLVIAKGIDVIMDAPIFYSANSGIALTIGTTGTANVNGYYRLNVVKTVLSTWVDGTVGIKMVCTYSSTIFIVEVAQFQEGLQCFGDGGQGFVYNNVFLGAVRNNKVGLRLTSNTGGYCNENNFFAGRFDCSSTTNTTISRNAIVITSLAAFYQNNNNFFKPSFELAFQYLSGGATSVPVLFEYAAINAIYDYRMEDSGLTTAIISNDSYRNVMRAGYGNNSFGGSLTNSGTYRDSTIESRDNVIPQNNPMRTVVFDSGPLAKIAVPYNTTEIMLPGMFAAGTGSAARVIGLSLSRINNEYLDVSATRFIGVMISTTFQKRLIIRRDFHTTSNPGRVVVRPYDINGTALGSGKVFATSGYGLTYDAGYAGGSYYAPESVADMFLAVASDVASLAVMVGSPDAGYCALKAFSVESLDGGSPAAWSYVDTDARLSLATATPTIWANSAPRHIFRADPTSGGPLGWSRVFKASTTVNGNEAAGQTVITVADATGIASGDIVTIKLDTGDFHHTTVNGAPAGNDVTITAALPSAAASGNGFWAARWKAMANLA